ncbi:MAG: type II CRISPR RNA-guided endonuclease Cas9 [Ignavibacteria bacterium]|nr:type II CRISPR RNA-guided endonuclease Cas9 [Ignavibacteria bacterium]
MKNTNFIWGFDQGANSIGWAILDIENEVIVDSGVRVFEAGSKDLGKGDSEISKNAEKRQHRAKMRAKTRKKSRLKRLIKELQKIDLLPKTITYEFFNELNPYKLRAEGIKQKIGQHELGRAIYHIAKHRGYKSNSKATEVNTDEKSKIFKGYDDKIGIEETRKNLDNSKYKTIGEYLNSLDSHEIRIRNRFTTRDMYEDEINKILEKQAVYYPDLLNEKNKEKIIKSVFFQRDLKSQKGRKGKCIFELNRPRASKAHPLYQEFRMLQQLNSLRIISPERNVPELQEPTSEERELLIEYLSANKHLNFGKDNNNLKKVLNIDKKSKIRINLESLDKLQGLDTLIKFKKIIIDKTFYENPENVEWLFNKIYIKNDNESFIEKFDNKFNFTKDQIIELSNLKLEPHYGSLSIKAVRKIIPFLREGLIYSEACEKAGYNHSVINEEIEIKDELPLPPKIANPVVTTALFELRTICNLLLEKYGRPETIKIENARDLKATKKERARIAKEQNTNRKYNENAKKEILKYKDKVSKNDIIKYKLWEEAGHTCPYTGKNVGVKDLFNGKVQIEHIIPYSKSLDDSFMNKTICLVEENAKKGNKTPYESYSGDKLKYEAILERASKLPYRKSLKFSFKGELEDKDEIRKDWISSKLNDTRYIVRETQNYLKNICEDVVTIKGGVTSKLRRNWGLNAILNETRSDSDPLKEVKNREDNRHHAIDAIVVAMTDFNHLRELSNSEERYIEKNWGEIKEHKEFPLPWDTFRDDVRTSISNIIVAVKQRDRKRGTFLKETNYGWRKFSNGEKRVNEKGYGLYSIRKPLNNLSKGELNSITDPKVKEIIFDKFYEMGFDPTNPSSTQMNKVFAEPIYFPETDRIIRKVRLDVASKTFKKVDKFERYLAYDSNYCLIIYKDLQDDKVKSEHYYLANVLNIDNIIDVFNRNNMNTEIITSVKSKDYFIKNDIPKEFDIEDKSTYNLVADRTYKVNTWTESSRQVELNLHNASIVKLGKTTFYPTSFNHTKVAINPIGELRYTK